MSAGLRFTIACLRQTRLENEMKRYKYTTCKQEGGDDGYCYVIRVNGEVVMSGLTRSEAREHRQRLEARLGLKDAEAKLRKSATSGLTVGAVLNHKHPIPKPKKYYLRTLEAFDREHDDCVVRELEMEVDSILNQDSGRIMQFWRDVQLYGVNEAIMYVRNESADQADRIEAAWEKIKVRLEVQDALAEQSANTRM